MNHRVLFFILLVCSAPAFAADSDNFFSWFSESFQSVSDFFNEAPGMIERASAYAVEQYTLGVIKAKLYAIKFAYGVAQQLFADLNVTQYMQSALSAMPPKLQFVMVELQIVNGLNLICHCYLTRFVLNLIGW